MYHRKTNTEMMHMDYLVLDANVAIPCLLFCSIQSFLVLFQHAFQNLESFITPFCLSNSFVYTNIPICICIRIVHRVLNSNLVLIEIRVFKLFWC